MKFDELKKELNSIKPISDADFDIPHMEQVEHMFFSAVKGQQDYRAEAIRFCLERGWSVTNTANNTYELSKRFIALRCPHCNKEMSQRGGGGNSECFSVSFACEECKTKGSLTFGIGCIRINGKEQ